MYKLGQTPFNLTEPTCIIREDGWCIPFDPDNTDYQAYLKWLAEGNQPLSAEETK